MVKKTAQEVFQWIKEMRIHSVNPVNDITNFYTFDQFTQDCYACRGKHTVIFSFQETFVKRGYFWSCDKEELSQMFSLFEKNTVIDYIYRPGHTSNRELLETNFHHHASYIRICNYNIKDFMIKNKNHLKEKEQGKKDFRSALPIETDRILNALYHEFDPRISHLYSQEKCKDLIAQENIYIMEEKDTIQVLTSFEITGRKLYFTYAFDHLHNGTVYAMINQKLEQFAKKEGKFFYAWVNAANERAKKFLMKNYGMETVELFDDIYIR